MVFGDPVLGNQLNIGEAEPIYGWTEETETVNLAEVSFGFDFTFLDNNQADEFTLATLTFNALAPGSSNLEFSNVSLADALGGSLTASLQNGAVSVEAVSLPTSVPEPSVAFALVGLGIAAVGNRLYKSSR